MGAGGDRQSMVTFFLPATWTGVKRSGRFMIQGLTMRLRVLWPKIEMISLWSMARVKFGRPRRKYLHLLTAQLAARASPLIGV